MCCEGLWFSYKIDAIDKMHSALLFIIMQTHYKTRMSDEPASSNESSIDECAGSGLLHTPYHPAYGPRVFSWGEEFH